MRMFSGRRAQDAFEQIRGGPVTWAALLVGLVAVGVHSGALAGGFVFDDHDNILGNPWITDVRQLGHAFTHHMAAYSPKYESSFYRPLMHVILAGAHGLFGMTAWGYHLVVVLLHAATCTAVFVLCARVARHPGRDDVAAGSVPRGAFVAALLFAVHPIHVEAVAWISGVVDLSYSLLGVLALLALTSTRPVARLVVAPVLFFVSLLGKEPALMVLPAFALFAAARGELEEATRRRQLLAAISAMVVALSAYLALRVAALGGFMGRGGARRIDVSLGEGLLTAAALFGQYFRMMLLPFGQSAVYDFRIASAVTDVRVWAGLAIVAVVGTLAWRARRAPPAVLGFALLVLPLLPAFYVPVLGEGLVADRYLYMPTVGLALLVAFAWEHVHWLPGRYGAWFRAAIATGILVVGAVATISRVRVWRDDVSLWTDATNKAPNSAAAHANLGSALGRAHQPAAAAASLVRALDLNPHRTDAREHLAMALLETGLPADALLQADKVLAEQPRHTGARAIRGEALAAQGRFAEAIAEYQRALELDPLSASVHNNLAIALLSVGDLGSAETHFREAVRIEPQNAAYAQNLIRLETDRKAGARDE
jgi:hypothetical protein